MSQALQVAIPGTQEFRGQPFLKWAGGKTQLLPKLAQFSPKDFSGYYEPFVGSAAVFFYLRRTRGVFPARLSDANAELVNCLRIVRDKVSCLVPLLRRYQAEHNEKYYYEVRKMVLGKATPLQRAARFIYLNKTCYNGLYRVNSKGQFNVPVGSYKKPRILDEKRLRAASESLRGVIIEHEDFSTVLDRAERGDLIYFDPPYYAEATGFTGYAVSPSGKAEFGAEEHRRLSEVVKELRERNCDVVVSNSDTRYIRYLYPKGEFKLNVVQARRMINCNGAGRGAVSELVITTR